MLENGSLIAKMSLDDPSQCQRVELYQGPGFPSTLDECSRGRSEGSPVERSSSEASLSPHQGYEITKTAIENALDGYCIPDEKKFKVATIVLRKKDLVYV